MIFQIFSELEPLYKELTQLHNKTQKSIKELERISLKLEIPAINELRNAFYHLNEALINSTSQEQSLELIKAINHCKRAYYDSKEIMLLYLLERVNEIKTEVSGHSHILRNHIKNYSEIKLSLEAALTFIQKTSPSKDKAEFYNKCDEHIENVLNYIKKYDSFKEDIDCEINERKSSNKTNKILLLVAVLGVIYSAIDIFSK